MADIPRAENKEILKKCNNIMIVTVGSSSIMHRCKKQSGHRGECRCFTCSITWVKTQKKTRQRSLARSLAKRGKSEPTTRFLLGALYDWVRIKEAKGDLNDWWGTYSCYSLNEILKLTQRRLKRDPKNPAYGID